MTLCLACSSGLYWSCRFGRNVSVRRSGYQPDLFHPQVVRQRHPDALAAQAQYPFHRSQVAARLRNVSNAVDPTGQPNAGANAGAFFEQPLDERHLLRQNEQLRLHVLGHLRLIFRENDGIVQRAEVVHQAALLRLPAGPDAPTGQRQQLLARQVHAGRLAVLNRLGAELIVDVLQQVLHGIALGFAELERPGDGARVLAAGQHFRANPRPLFQPARHELAGDHADRSSQRPRLGKNRLAAHADVVAAAGRDIAHAGHGWLLALAQLVPDQVARQRGAARAIDAQHNCLHGVVLLRLTNCIDHGRGADRAAAEYPLTALPRVDRPDGVDHRDLRLLRRRRLLLRAHQFHEGGERVAVQLRRALAVVAGDLDLFLLDAVLDLILQHLAVSDAIHQPQLLRLAGGVRTFVDDLLDLLRRPIPRRPRGDDGLYHAVLVQVVEHEVELLAVLLAHFGARERLGSALGLAHLQEVGLHADLVEQFLVEAHFDAQAKERE